MAWALSGLISVRTRRWQWRSLTSGFVCENCQLAVHLSYASPLGHTLLAVALDL